MSVELWTSGVGLPKSTVRQARQAEDEGWDGLGLVDSQNLAGDPYVELALAAGVTTTLQLATAVTNPVTRHPAVAATAIATVQGESGGRAVLGIGRGDSALAHLGLSPAPVRVFERYLARLQGYLRGDEVDFDVATDGGGEVRSSDALGMAGGPTSSRIRWLRSTQAKVPVDVAATGPKVIAAGARHAERVTFAVGVAPERISWAVDLARSVNPDVELGAYVPVLVHPDRDEARRLIAGAVGSYARFSVMHGTVAGPVPEEQRERLEAVHDAYDMGAHFSHGSPQSQQLDEGVIDAFGIAGPPGYCIEKILELESLGIRRIFAMGTGIGLDREDAMASRARLVGEVLPAVRG